MRAIPFLPSVVALILPLPLVAGDAKAPISSSGGDWEFSISAGPSIRNVGKLTMQGGYRSGGVVLPSFVGSDSLTVPDIGPDDAYADRFYNNGYVRQDAGTPGDGSTWYWGYDSADQIVGDQLVFQATGFRSVRSDTLNVPAAGPRDRESLRDIAPHLQFDARSPHHVGPFRLGFSVGMDFTKVDHSTSFSNFSALQTREDFEDTYEHRFDLGGVIPPGAPYAGSLGGPGPLINNLPAGPRTITSQLLFTDTAVFGNAVSSSIDIGAWSFTFGPTLGMQRGNFDFALSGGLVLNIYDWKTKQKERLDVTTGAGSSTYASWSEKDSGVKIRPGIYVQGDAAYAFDRNWALGGFLRLDAAEDFRVKAGPSVYKIDPYGVTAGLQIRYTLP